MKKLIRTLIVWISIYPPLTLLILIFGDYLEHLSVPLRTLLLTAILVPLMIYILIPFWTKVYEYVLATLQKPKTKQES